MNKKKKAAFISRVQHFNGGFDGDIKKFWINFESRLSKLTLAAAAILFGKVLR